MGSDPRVYEARLLKADDTPVTVAVNADFEVTATLT